MTEVEVLGTLDGVSFQPASELEEIIQNVKTILATRVGTVPLDRRFGLDWDFIDRPISQARAAFISEAVRKLQRYEPRCKVIRIELVEDQTAAQDGKLIPRVAIGVNP